MKDHFEFSDSAFENAVRECTLHPSLFSHEAHLRLAWLHIDKYGPGQATGNISRQLRRFVQKQGGVDKYNVTVTIAAIRIVYHFKLRSCSDNFQDFIQEFPRLKTGFKYLLGCHYITDIFSSAQAKKKFLEPELLPFDEV
jgi:hypothetical protein